MSRSVSHSKPSSAYGGSRPPSAQEFRSPVMDDESTDLIEGKEKLQGNTFALL